jgi:hypothetical protein
MQPGPLSWQQTPMALPKAALGVAPPAPARHGQALRLTGVASWRRHQRRHSPQQLPPVQPARSRSCRMPRAQQLTHAPQLPGSCMAWHGAAPAWRQAPWPAGWLAARPGRQAARRPQLLPVPQAAQSPWPGRRHPHHRRSTKKMSCSCTWTCPLRYALLHTCCCCVPTLPASQHHPRPLAWPCDGPTAAR